MNAICSKLKDLLSGRRPSTPAGTLVGVMHGEQTEVLEQLERHLVLPSLIPARTLPPTQLQRLRRPTACVTLKHTHCSKQPRKVHRGARPGSFGRAHGTKARYQ